MLTTSHYQCVSAGDNLNILKWLKVNYTTSRRADTGLAWLTQSAKTCVKLSLSALA